MSFWSQTTAAPTIWHLSGMASRNARFLRTAAPPELPTGWSMAGESGFTATIRQITPSDSEQVCRFLETHYGSRDWLLQKTDEWIQKYLIDLDVICLGLIHDTTGEILATIFSTPLSGSGGFTRMTHSGIQMPNVRVIEGLCVSNTLRKKGIAGFMISHIDSWTHRMFGPTAHIWSKELEFVPFVSTALSIDIYSYKFCVATHESAAMLMPFSDFSRLWELNCDFWSEFPAIIASKPQNRRGGILVFLYQDRLIVVANTQRVAEGRTIYEIVWCGRTRGGRLFPNNVFLDFKEAMNAVCCHSALDGGILFGTNSPIGGGIDADWESEGWTFGTSGAHAWYIYNYMPPSFGDCRIMSVREEL